MNRDFSPCVIKKNIKRLINLVYKLLPLREENGDWVKLLQTIIVELYGLKSMLVDQQDSLFLLICKLEGMLSLTEEEDFDLYRRSIFDCLNLMSDIKENV